MKRRKKASSPVPMATRIPLPSTGLAPDPGAKFLRRVVLAFGGAGLLFLALLTYTATMPTPGNILAIIGQVAAGLLAVYFSITGE